jgi:hypothetical protein
MIEMNSAELRAAAQSGAFSPEDKARLFEESVRRSDAEHDWSIIGGTGTGIGIIADAALASVPPIFSAGKLGGRVFAARSGGRAPIFADNDVLIAAERGNTAALAEIRAGQTFVTPNQLREFINPAAIPGHQLATRRALLQAEGIQVYGGSSAAQAAAGSNFQNVFRATTAGQHGRADAALGAFARETGFEAVTMERRITNFFNLTRPDLQVPIRRVTP